MLEALHEKIAPVFQSYGVSSPSAETMAMNLAMEIATAIAQHCPTFPGSIRRVDPRLAADPWDVKVCKTSGRPMDPSASVNGKTSLVVNYRAKAQVVRIWAVWQADELSTGGADDSTAQEPQSHAGAPRIEIVLDVQAARTKSGPKMLKASLPVRPKVRAR
ncbi:MAG: hypothetical protein ABL961_00070 [Vicinamibacterales bacterium]